MFRFFLLFAQTNDIFIVSTSGGDVLPPPSPTRSLSPPSPLRIPPPLAAPSALHLLPRRQTKQSLCNNKQPRCTARPPLPRSTWPPRCSPSSRGFGRVPLLRKSPGPSVATWGVVMYVPCIATYLYVCICLSVYLPICYLYFYVTILSLSI